MERVIGLFTPPVEGKDASVSRRDSPREYDESVAARGVSEDAFTTFHDNARGSPSEGDVGYISPGRCIGSREGSQRSSPASSIADSIQSAARLEELRLKLEMRKMEIEAEER
ncbi:hypothetical protein E2C01_092165 [Portunus trituberculatus]|uniref:Uncharacterized protein n=1 Tax=Portunus trituberculatus TaxID=210409 RepID=A0A5B7JQN0_PORTR|nr:hypothetical protein [Portunus trituberculatus]